MASGDHPGIPFLEARQTDGSPAYTAGRRGKTPRFIVVHDMEENEAGNIAENVAQYFHTGAGGRSVSSHYTADNNSIVQCVPLSASAWTVGNRPGNDEGINWEFAGFKTQTREQWLDPFGIAMFTLAAPIIRADAARYGIPLRTLTDDEVRAGAAGVSSHWQLGRVYGGTDHDDPGPNFPWDWFITLLNQTEDDMAYLVRVADQGGATYLVTGGIAASGRVAAYHLTPEAFKAHQALGLTQVNVDHAADVADVYDFDPQPFPSGGGGPRSLVVNLTGTAEPAP